MSEKTINDRARFEVRRQGRRIDRGERRTVVVPLNLFDPLGAAAAVSALALLKANNLSDLPNKPTARTNLGLGSIAVQNANAVSIAGGTISGITDLAVADGGTGASNAPDARTNLGLGTMAVQAQIAAHADLTWVDGPTLVADINNLLAQERAAGARAT